MKRLSKINESIWSDIQRRAEGSDKRKEDEIINNLQDLREYINSHIRDNSDVLDLRDINLNNLDSLYTSSNRDYLFKLPEHIKKIDVTGWKTSTITDMSSIFSNCAYIDEIIGLDTWDVSNVTSMENMFFSSCIKKIDIHNWNLKNIEDMKHMFAWCNELKEFNVDWNLDSVNEINMCDMFGGCKKIKKLDLNSWNVSKVKDMSSMFNKCEALEELNIDKWNVENVENMTLMFSECRSLKKLNLENWKLKDGLIIGFIFSDANTECKHTKQGNRFIYTPGK